VAEFYNYPLAKYYWHSIVVDWSLCGDAIGEIPYTKLAGFAQGTLCSEYYTPMLKWNKYSIR